MTIANHHLIAFICVCVCALCIRLHKLISFSLLCRWPVTFSRATQCTPIFSRWKKKKKKQPHINWCEHFFFYIIFYHLVYSHFYFDDCVYVCKFVRLFIYLIHFVRSNEHESLAFHRNIYKHKRTRLRSQQPKRHLEFQYSFVFFFICFDCCIELLCYYSIHQHHQQQHFDYCYCCALMWFSSHIFFYFFFFCVLHETFTSVHTSSFPWCMLINIARKLMSIIVNEKCRVSRRALSMSFNLTYTRFYQRHIPHFNVLHWYIHHQSSCNIFIVYIAHALTAITICPFAIALSSACEIHANYAHFNDLTVYLLNFTLISVFYLTYARQLIRTVNEPNYMSQWTCFKPKMSI